MNAMSRNKPDVKKLFELWCIVSKSYGNTGRSMVIEHFPENYLDKKTLADIPAFAFPCEDERDKVEMYSFVLTRVDSKWRYGFCRYDPKEQTAMVLITYLPWHDTFMQLLKVLAELRQKDNGELSSFLMKTFNHGIPDAGASFKVLYESGHKYFEFKHPSPFELPSIPQNHNLNLYYNFAEPKNMVAVFAAMLAERRIIFTSRILERLSSCIQAANAFLYPMVWQHIYVPLLPVSMKDYLSAPMPYLIGVPEGVLKSMSFDELGDVVIFYCDRNVIESPFDDVHAMPSEIVSQLKKQLSKSQELIGDRISKIFLEALVQLIGGYRDAVEFRGSRNTFNMDKFIATRPSNLRPFLTKMMDLQIFQQFIDERMDNLNEGLGYSDEFEVAIARYSEKMKKRRTFLPNHAKSAVKSVKDSSRGIKTVYRDLKSKLTQQNSTAPHFRSHLNSNSQHDHIDGDLMCGKSTATCHRSVPSSPVCGKRNKVHKHQTQGFQYTSPDPLNGYQSASRPLPSMAGANSHANAHIRAKAGASPIMAHPNTRQSPSPCYTPGHSPCASEMNLTQELQNHPLFKMTTVDRSIKSEHSPDLNHRITMSRVRGPHRVHPPVPGIYYLEHEKEHNLKSVPLYYNQPNATKQILRPHQHYTFKASLVPRASALKIAPMIPVMSKITTTDSLFDNPPDVQSPPVPPRRHQNRNQHAEIDTTFINDCHIAAAAGPTGRARSNIENNKWNCDDQRLSQQDMLRCSTLSSTSTESSSAGSVASFASALSHLTLTNEISLAPMSTPHHKKEKESLLSLQPYYQQCSKHAPTAAISRQTVSSNSLHVAKDSVKDLISLHDNNVNFELEDFDPLNKNARPLPTSSTNLEKPTSVIDNQIFPFSVDKIATAPPSLPIRAMSSANDFELLRKYGLDQFTVTVPVPPSADSAVSTSKNVAFSNGKSNWMTFE